PISDAYRQVRGITQVGQLVYIRQMAKQLTDLQRYALLGAQARLQQLAQETVAIYRQFPQLRDGRASRPDEADSTPASPVRRRKGRDMSAANRQAVSERM